MSERIITKHPFEGVVESRIGGRNENQDNWASADTPLGLAVLVCDGMGGMNGGQTASWLAVNTIITDLSSADAGSDREEALRQAIIHANSVIIERGEKDTTLYGMGTTVTALLINETEALVAHAGDSRIYQLRKGKKIFRTFDDSVVFQQVLAGLITEEEARTAENANIIMKALGVNSFLDFEIKHLTYKKGDRFVLCTDGFWGTMPERELLKLVSVERELDLVLDKAADVADELGAHSKDGHHDNLTAAIVDTCIRSKKRSKKEKRARCISFFLALILVLGAAFFCYQKFSTEDSNETSFVEISSEVSDTLE